MDDIKISKVANARLKKRGDWHTGTLHLTAYHLIFRSNSGEELWVGYPLMYAVELVKPQPVRSRKSRRSGAAIAAAGIGRGSGSPSATPATPDDDDASSVYSSSHDGASDSSVTTTTAATTNSAATIPGDHGVRNTTGVINIQCHDFLMISLVCPTVAETCDVFLTIQNLICVDSVERLYAFHYRPLELATGAASNGWDIYDPEKEFRRMGVGSAAGNDLGANWRFTDLNCNYQLSPTYPRILVVPARITDTTLAYAAQYRSKQRFPALSYWHAPTSASITRSSQPMVGIRQARSIQDEKLVEAIISTSQPNGVPLRYQELRKHVIIDARPTTNAMANRAIGAGSENMDHYRYCRKIYLGIENIHIMREALSKVMAAIRHSGKAASGYRAKTLAMQAREGWCKHVSAILEGAATVVKAIEAGEHVLIHCSDGWDRTSQLTSLAQLCLDPYYRTLQGFAVLIEKEWVSFGYKFTHRSGLLNQSHKCHVRAKTHSRNHESHSELIGGEAVATAAIATTSSPSSPSLLARGEPRRPSSKKKVSPAGSEATSLRGQGGGFFDNISSSTGIDFAQHSSAFSKFASRTLRSVQDHLSSAIQSVGAADTESEDEFDRCLAKQQKSSRRPSRRFKFADRQKADTEFSPVFHQFLDCVFQLWLQYPDRFEFNEEYLLDIHYHIYSCQFGTFIGNSQRERQEWDLPANTISIWPWLHQRQGRYLNDLWNGRRARCDTEDMIHPDSRHVQFWTTLFKQERESVGENLFNVCKSRKADSGDISSSSSSNSSSPSPQNDAGENQEGGNADKLVISDGDQSPEVISVPSSSVGTNLSNDVEYSEGSSLEREFGSVYIDRHHVKGSDGELSVPKKTTSTSEWDALSLNPWTDLDPRSHPEEGTQADTAAATATAAAIIDAGGDSALRRSVFLRSDPLRSALAGAQSENISPVLASTLPPISTKNTAPCSAKPFFADEEEAN